MLQEMGMNNLKNVVDVTQPPPPTTRQGRRQQGPQQ
jgi:hypothetical protein